MNKKRVNNIDVVKKHDFFEVTEKNGKKSIVYIEDYLCMIQCLKQIDEKRYKNICIPASAIAKKLYKKNHDIKRVLFRPTGEYRRLYYMTLKLLDHYRYIDYYKKWGLILKREKFKNIATKKGKKSIWNKLIGFK